jgi:hypothetical protein
MPEVAVNKRTVSLPWTVAVSVIVAIISGSGVFFTLKGDVAAAQTYTERVEKAHVERFVSAERRIERVEDTNARVVILLERIDERTLEMKRRMDSAKQ